MEKTSLLSEDWAVLTRFLPSGWEEKAKELGAYRRFRRFSTVGSLLRVLLIHVLQGCSLRETVVRAGQGGIARLSAVALFKRLRLASEWLRWMAVEVMYTWLVRQQPSGAWGDLRVRVIDGTNVQEPGSKGTSWRIHYSIQLSSLTCDEFKVTDPKTGESFKHFSVKPGDLLLGDRNFAKKPGIAHVCARGGHVLVRINLTGTVFLSQDNQRFDIVRHLRSLREGELGDWDVWVQDGDVLIPGRICAVKKSEAAAEKAKRKILREAKKKKRTVRPETLESAGYVFLFTTLGRVFSANQVLEIYRVRWQVELAFKRLKSLLRLGDLRKFDTDSVMAWIHAKLLVAVLIEALRAASNSFFPWGYPIHDGSQHESLHLAGDVIDAALPEPSH
jgi:hypothetical protein